MKLKNTLALSLAAVMAAGLTACGSGASPAADSTAAESTEAAADTTAAPWFNAWGHQTPLGYKKPKKAKKGGAK